MHSHLSAIKREGPENVDQLVNIACSLAQQNAMQSAIIRQAIHHVSLLEMQAELHNRKHPPRVIRWLLDLFGQ
jgi:hypothetical protein